MMVLHPAQRGQHPARYRSGLTFAAMILVAVSPAFAQDPEVHPTIPGHFVNLSGARTYELMQDCDRAPAGEITTCGGYIVGVFDALSAVGEVCRPEGADDTDGAVILRVHDALAAEPGEWSRNPALLIRDTLRAAWPCRGGQQPSPSKEFAPGTTLSLEQIMKAKGAEQ